MSRVMKAVPFVALCAFIVAVPSLWANWVQDGVALCTTMKNQEYPQIVSDGAGGAIVTWLDSRSPDAYDIYAQRVSASGAVQWTANGVALCTAPWGQTRPRLASDGAGGAIVVWEDFRMGNYDAYNDIYAQRVDASGAVQWTADGVALCTATGDQTWPEITSDGADGAIVAWYDKRSGNYDIYAQRVNALGIVQWTADGLALCTTTEYQANPQITPDGVGGAIVAWTDYRGGKYNIYAQRLSASGAVQWTVDGVALCTSTEYQGIQQITSDGASGAIVTWTDQRSGNYDIYAQRVNASGAVQWTADGVAISTATGDQYYSQSTPDGAGGAIVAWPDGRSGNYDIYAQRVNASGAVQWTADGVALCAATNTQLYSQITSDGAGGAIVTWHDYRSGNYDIYAQRVNASGAVQWTSDGVALCTVTGDQHYPAITSDGASGAIVTWYDYRLFGNYDIYAQRVDANGFAVLTAADEPPAPVELHQNYPNPFNPATTLTYSVLEKCNVTLKIYDISGTCIASLVDGQREKGSYAVEWNGKDEKGNSLASGIYLCKLAAGDQTISKKMVLLR